VSRPFIVIISHRHYRTAALCQIVSEHHNKKNQNAKNCHKKRNRISTNRTILIKMNNCIEKTVIFHTCTEHQHQKCAKLTVRQYIISHYIIHLLHFWMGSKILHCGNSTKKLFLKNPSINMETKKWTSNRLMQFNAASNVL